MKPLKKVKYIIVHCSATPEGKDYTAADIDRWHRQQGWECIGYHYVVRLDGMLEPGRSIKYQGAHCKPLNSVSIGISEDSARTASPRTRGLTFRRWFSTISLLS